MSVLRAKYVQRCGLDRDPAMPRSGPADGSGVAHRHQRWPGDPHQRQLIYYEPECLSPPVPYEIGGASLSLVFQAIHLGVKRTPLEQGEWGGSALDGTVAGAPGAWLPSVLPDVTLVGSSLQDHTRTNPGSPILCTPQRRLRPPSCALAKGLP